MSSGTSTKACASCGTPRGNQRTAWVPITQGEAVVGYTCPVCPAAVEPIRRVETKPGRVVFRARLDGTRAERGRPRQQVSGSFDTLNEAREWVAEVRAAVSASGLYGAAARAASETVGHLCERWVASRVDVRQVTQEGYRQWLAPIHRHSIATMPITEVKIADVQNLIAWLAKEGMRPRKGRAVGTALSPSSIRSVKVALKQAFDLAVTEETLARNVVPLAKWPSVPSSRREHLYWETVGEAATAACPDMLKFRRLADTDSLAAAWRLTLCGMTRADIMGLRWRDIDLDQGVASVVQGRVAVEHGDSVGEPKSEQRVRTIPFEAIHEGTTALLRRLRAAQAANKMAAGEAWRDSGLVVVDDIGEPLAPAVYSDRFRRLCVEAGVPSITLHSVRHSIAVLLEARGSTANEIAALLGHTVEVLLGSYLLPRGQAGVRIASRHLGEAMRAVS